MPSTHPRRPFAGLEPRFTEIYLHAVRVPGITKARLLAEHVPPETLDVALAELMSRGLLRPGAEDGSWEAVPPEVALHGLANMWDSRAAETRAMMPDLSQLYHHVRAPKRRAEAPQGVRILTNLQDLHDTTADVVASASQELRRLYASTPRTAFVFAEDPSESPLTRGAGYGRPVRQRTIYDTYVMVMPQALHVFSRRAAAGEEFRFLTDLTTSVVIADDTRAVIDLTSFDSSGAGSIHVTDRRMVLALMDMWESWWRRATPGMSTVESDELDTRSRDILRLLAAGATDATIAMQTGLSQRTVERGVRAVMDRLGATTRFQAGVQAALRGWL